jgi:hypothetical protein
MQTDPADVIRAWELYKQNPEENLLIKGRRVKRRFAEAFFTWGMQVLAQILLKARLHDINAQPKLFGRRFYESIHKEAPHDFALDVYFLYQAVKKGRVLTIPVEFKKRLHGEAKGGGSFKTRIKLIKRTWSYLWELRRKLKQERNS